MRIYNCTNYDIKLNIIGYNNEYNTVKPNTKSHDFHPTERFIRYITNNFTTNNIILIPEAFHDLTIISLIPYGSEFVRDYNNITLTDITEELKLKLNIIDNVINITYPLEICKILDMNDGILLHAEE